MFFAYHPIYSCAYIKFFNSIKFECGKAIVLLELPYTDSVLFSEKNAYHIRE